LTGANFLAGSVVDLNGSALTPVFISSTDLFIVLPPQSAGSGQVLVANGSLQSSFASITFKAPSPTPDPTAGGELKIIGGTAIPNPNPDVIAVDLLGPADRVRGEVFTKAENLALEFEQDGFQAGWSQIALPGAWRGLPNGIYYVRLLATRGSQISAAVVVKVMVLR
jgi:hypothetical protein